MDLGNDSIRPQDFSTPTSCVIAYSADGKDCIEVTKKTSKAGIDFQQYTLFVDINGDKRAINYLMRSDLKPLRDKYGRNSEFWVGKTISITGTKEGEYFRWKLE